MEINTRIQFVKGAFDTKKDKLICVPYHKHGEVLLCFKSNMNVPFAKIKLYSSDRFVDFDATYKDASALGEEIARRFNEFPQDQKL